MLIRREHIEDRHARFAWRSLSSLSLAALVLLAACRAEPEFDAYVVRVGNEVLTHEELAAALAGVPPGLDSTDASHQYIERWITGRLLAQEAERRGLRRDEEVQRQLEESERSVLTTAMINRLYEEGDEEPTDAEVRSFFEAHSEQLQLREPFVLVRYLFTSSAEDGAAARAELQRAVQTGAADTLWGDIMQRYAEDTDVAMGFSDNYYPESRILRSIPPLREAFSNLRVGQISPMVESNGQYHVMQLVHRVPAGTVPRLEWVEDELRQRIRISIRKQIYTRQVQRLRNEALARDELEIRQP